MIPASGANNGGQLSLNGSWVEVSESRLRENLKTFRRILEPKTKLLTVVKSNAYGHGLELTAQTIATETDWFGVDSVAEALAISSMAADKPILILGYSAAEHAAQIVANDIRQVVYRMDVAKAISAEAIRQETSARIHLKIETGTNRQGISIANVAKFAQAVAALPGIEVEGVYTHFANIEDTLDPSFAKEQLGRFNTAVEILRNVGIYPREIHAAATAGILLYPETHFTMVRLGIGAYGIWPSRETRLAALERGSNITLQPVLSWKTRIVQLKQIKTGEFVGYGLSFQAGRPMTLAIVPTGYYEGYDRHLSSIGRAIVRGQPVQVVGRVAMNMTILDVTEVDGPKLDEEVVLLGQQGETEVSADELANKIGTIPYEVLARINVEVERKLI